MSSGCRGIQMHSPPAPRLILLMLPRTPLQMPLHPAQRAPAQPSPLSHLVLRRSRPQLRSRLRRRAQSRFTSSRASTNSQSCWRRRWWTCMLCKKCGALSNPCGSLQTLAGIQQHCLGQGAACMATHQWWLPWRASAWHRTPWLAASCLHLHACTAPQQASHQLA